MSEYTIYIASKTKHAKRWIALREKGWRIISSWIDEAGEGQSADLEDLAKRCIYEPTIADFTILYCEKDDHLKFVLAEVGAALAAGNRVIVVGADNSSVSPTMLKHPRIRVAGGMIEALAYCNPIHTLPF